MTHPHNPPEGHPKTGSVPTETIVEKARFRDLPAVVRIQRASFRPGLAYRYFVLLTLWLLPFVTFLVARRRPTGQVVGCVIGDRVRDTVRIMNIAVHPEARRQGVGTALLDAIGEVLSSGDIVLMVEEHNHGAQALYTAQGFTRTGFQRNYYGPNRHGIEMTLRRNHLPRPQPGKPTSGRIRV